MIKQSLFNIPINTKKIKRNKEVLYNSLSGSLIEIDSDVIDYFSLTNYKEIQESDVDKKYFDYYLQLRNGNFLIDKNTDEIETLKYLYNQSRFHTNVTNLTILPTLNCNLKCPYCYQQHNDASFMTKEVQDKIIEYVKKRIAQKTTSIHIAWYGGEPLLGLDIIGYLSQNIIKLANESNTRYSSNIVSNGFLLNKEIIKKLIEYKIGSIQITLDGIPETHDTKRVMKNGDGTFWKILNNIKLISQDIQVQVRINIDKNNLKDINKLLALFEENNLDKGKIFPYLGLIKSTTTACNDVSSSCLNGKYFASIYSKFIDEIYRRGYKSHFYPEPSYVICGAISEGFFSIDPKGNIYKCWETVAVEEESVGNILMDNLPANLQANYFNWMNYDPFTNKKCIKCNIFPICFGGCPSGRIKHPSDQIKNIGKCSTYFYKNFMNKVMDLVIDRYEKGDLAQKIEVCDKCSDNKETTDTTLNS